MLLAAAALASVTWAFAAPARADSCPPGAQLCAFGQYGEVWRGGGFDTSAYAQGKYNGPLTPGKFVDPVGFTVDTQDTTPGGDGTAIYVLDRTSNLPGSLLGGTTSWRLQKLDDQGHVLGTDLFTLPADANSDEMLGLAVDPSDGRVYSLLVAFDQNQDVNPNFGGAEVVDEILSWSTTPNGSGQLAGASGLSGDTVSSGTAGYPTPSVLSTATQLLPQGNPQKGSAKIETPQGLALDVSGSTDYLAVESADDDSADLQSGDVAGAGIAQVCAMSKCGKAASGSVTDQWSSNVLNGLTNDNAEFIDPPVGIATAPDGSLTVLLDEQSGQAPSNIDVVDVPADLTTTPSILSSTINTVTNSDLDTVAYDDAAVFADDQAPNTGDFSGTDPATNFAGPQIVGLRNGLYAGEFEPNPVGAPDPQNPNGVSGLWTQHNPGIRLLDPLSDGELSEAAPPLSTLYDTLGNATSNSSSWTEAASACSLSDATTAAAGNTASPMPSLAAGANGTIWVLNRGTDSSDPSLGNPTGGRQLVELAPNAGQPCPEPTGTFTMASSSGTPQAASTSTAIDVQEGGTLQLNACPAATAVFPACPPTGSVGINYLGGATDEYVWNFGDGSPPDAILGGDQQPFTWPSGGDTHQYKTTGQYTVTLQVFGDFGEYDESGLVNVQSASVPSASFGATPAGTPLTMNFDASNSTPSRGATIIDYQWEFGDGQIDDTAAPVDTHTYASAGTYTVRLTIIDSSYGHSKPASQTITVTAPPPPPPPTTTTTSTAPPPPPGPPHVTARVAAATPSHNRVIVVVSCPTGQTSCMGTIQLTTVKAVATQARSKAHKPAKRKLVLGKGSFTVLGNSAKNISVVISKAGMALLRKSRRVPVLVTISAHNPQGASAVTHYQVTLRLPASHHSSGHSGHGKKPKPKGVQIG